MSNKIVVNGRCFARRITGVERHAREIMLRLQPTARLVTSPLGLNPFFANMWEQFVLPAHLRRDETLWSPANAGPWKIAQQVLTLHDASVFDHPEWFRPAFAAWTRLSWRVLSIQCTSLVTVSEFSRTRLVHYLPRAAGKLHVIQNGVGDPFSPQSRTAIESVREKYGLRGPYVLFVGTPQPRKNLSMLAAAMKELRRTDCALFCVGAPAGAFQSESAGLPFADVPDLDLPALYSGAAAFVTASLYEGSCLPALEAMACGTPVIAPNASAFPELLGDAALLFEPQNIASLIDALQSILMDEALANRLRLAGLVLARQCTWDRAATKYADLLRGPS